MSRHCSAKKIKVCNVCRKISHLNPFSSPLSRKRHLLDPLQSTWRDPSRSRFVKIGPCRHPGATLIVTGRSMVARTTTCWGPKKCNFRKKCEKVKKVQIWRNYRNFVKFVIFHFSGKLAKFREICQLCEKGGVSRKADLQILAKTCSFLHL